MSGHVEKLRQIEADREERARFMRRFAIVEQGLLLSLLLASLLVVAFTNAPGNVVRVLVAAAMACAFTGLLLLVLVKRVGDELRKSTYALHDAFWLDQFDEYQRSE